MTIGRFPPSTSDNPVTAVTFNGSDNLIPIYYLNMFIRVGGGTSLNFIGKTDGGIDPVWIKTPFFYTIAEMIGPDNLPHYLMSLTKSGSSARGEGGVTGVTDSSGAGSGSETVGSTTGAVSVG